MVSQPGACGKLSSVAGCLTWCWCGGAAPQAEAAGRWEEQNCVHSCSCFFRRVCAEGLGRDTGRLPVSRCWVGHVRSCRVGSGVQGGLGQGSNSVFAKNLCSTINGTVFLSIKGHSEFCGVGFGKDFVIFFNNLLFSVAPLFLSFNFSKISLSASGSP